MVTSAGMSTSTYMKSTAARWSAITGFESEEATEVGAKAPEVLAAGVVAVQRCGEVEDRPATPAAAVAVPAASGGLVDMQTCMPVWMERATDFAMAWHFDAEQSPHVDVRRDLQQRVVAALGVRDRRAGARRPWRVGQPARGSSCPIVRVVVGSRLRATVAP